MHLALLLECEFHNMASVAFKKQSQEQNEIFGGKYRVSSVRIIPDYGLDD